MIITEHVNCYFIHLSNLNMETHTECTAKYLRMQMAGNSFVVHSCRESKNALIRDIELDLDLQRYFKDKVF